MLICRWKLPHQLQFEAGDADRKIKPGLPLHRKRLQAYSAARANEYISSNTGTNCRLGRSASIAAGERTKIAIGRRKNGPNHLATSSSAEIKAELGDRAAIGAARAALV
jgi:hypothetical protein